MTNTNITAFQKNLFEFVEQAVVYGDVVNVSTEHGNAVVMSEDGYKSMIETLRLISIPGSIKSAANEPLEDCTPYDSSEAW